MALARWKVASVAGAVCWVRYDDATMEITSFEVNNEGQPVRLLSRRPGYDPTVLLIPDHYAAITDLTGVGQLTEQSEDPGDYDLPVGLLFEFETLPSA